MVVTAVRRARLIRALFPRKQRSDQRSAIVSSPRALAPDERHELVARDKARYRRGHSFAAPLPGLRGKRQRLTQKAIQ